LVSLPARSLQRNGRQEDLRILSHIEIQEPIYDSFLAELAASDEGGYTNPNKKATGRRRKNNGRRVNQSFQRNQALVVVCQALMEYFQHQRLTNIDASAK
jgi:hypothetical protein